MAAPSPLNKNLWRELTDIKNLTKDKNLKQGKFFYEKSSFDVSPEDLPEDYAQNLIVGKLWLTSNIYKNHALQVEIHLPSDYPLKPAEVVIATPIFHPNVNEKNRVCDPRLHANMIWNSKTTLMQILEIIVDALDNPKCDDGAVNIEAAKLYKSNRAEYDKKASAMLEKNG